MVHDVTENCGPVSQREERVRWIVQKMTEPDTKVVAELRSGDVRAFEKVYARYRVSVFGFLVRLCKSRVLAEDLFQNTWLKLARAAPRLRPDTNLRAWLFTVARNEWRSHRRWEVLDLSRLFAFRQALGTELASHGEEHRRGVAQAIGCLPASDREVLLLVAAIGFEPREAAEILGISYEALRQRLARARARLEQRLRASPE
jgi:RNA polymerase sigma-70 factor (ECF subfamily)